MIVAPYHFSVLRADQARAIAAWRYEGPYAVYNMDASDQGVLDELLDRRSPYYAVRDADDALVGFFAFGSAAEVQGDGPPHLMDDDQILSVGLGLRPDLTGSGLGLTFVAAGLEFARQTYAPAAFRLFVITFNQRAIRVYERAGFAGVRVVRVPTADGGEREFLEMRRPASDPA